MSQSIISPYAPTAADQNQYPTHPSQTDRPIVFALANYELRAPFDGRLLSLDLTVGESVSPGVPVAFIGDTGQWQVETTDLAEIDITNVTLGDPVILKLDAFPGEEFPGKVVEIDPVGREYLGDMTYKVTVLLDTPDERFKWNMTAIVSIGEN